MAEACQQLLEDVDSDSIDELSCSPDSQYDSDCSQLSFTNYTITIHQDYTRILNWNFIQIVGLSKLTVPFIYFSQGIWSPTGK